MSATALHHRIDLRPKSGNHLAGLTLIELLVVMAVIGLLLSIVAPRYNEHVDRAREAVLKQNLASLRESIDKFYADRARYPRSLEELVQQRYLRAIPLDPITDRHDSWITLPPPGSASADVVFNVRSGAAGQSREGTPYATW